MTDAPRDFDALLAAMIDQTITPDQRDALGTMMRDDVDLRRQYIEHMVLDADMHWDHRHAPAEPAARVQDSGFRVLGGNSLPKVGAAKLEIRNSKHKNTAPPQFAAGVSSSFEFRISSFALTAAALIALALTAWFLLAPEPRTLNPEPSSPSAPVATLTGAEGAVFAEDQPPVQLGGELAPGVMKLTAGSAQVMFNSGAVVDLIGPCEFEMTGPNRGRLTAGQLEAYVPPQAKRFTVETARGLRLTDLGTRFTVISGPDRDRVSVLEGVVLAEVGERRVTLAAPTTAYAVAGKLIVTETRTVLIDVGRGSLTTGTPGGQTWNNFAPRDTGEVQPAAVTPDVPNLLFSDGTASGISFDLSGPTPSPNGQGISGADWFDDLGGDISSYGYPDSATRDTFYTNRDLNSTFTFSNLRTDGTRYDLTVFGAFRRAERPETTITVGRVDKPYDPNKAGQVTFTDLLPDVRGVITFTVHTAGHDYGYLNVITLSEVTAAPVRDGGVRPATLPHPRKGD